MRTIAHRRPGGAQRITAALALAAIVGCAARRGARPPRTPAVAAPSPPAAAPSGRCGGCADPAPLEVSRVTMLAGRHGGGRLRVEAVLPAAQFAEANPLVDDVRIALRDGGGELLCASVEHEYWTRKHGVYRFQDRVLNGRRRRTAGLTDGMLAVRRDGAAVFRARADRIDVARQPRGTVTVTIWIGGRCAAGGVAR